MPSVWAPRDELTAPFACVDTSYRVYPDATRGTHMCPSCGSGTKLPVPVPPVSAAGLIRRKEPEERRRSRPLLLSRAETNVRYLSGDAVWVHFKF